MKNTSFSSLPFVSFDPNINYSLSNSYVNSPIPYVPNIDATKDNEERLIPFIGGAVLGGIAGNAFARPYYGYGYAPYNYGYVAPYYYPSYYSYGVGYLPNTYNYYYSGQRTTR